MRTYEVRETITIVHHIEAVSEAEAIRKAGDRGPRDFDEIDCSPSGANGPMTARLIDEDA